MLELEEVSKRFGDQVAVGPLSLKIAQAETTVLIGPSGCGKSTLIRLMIGLLAPDTGSVIFDGESLAVADLPTVRRRMGYVIQEGGLFPHLTARRNVTLMARHLGWDPGRIESRVAELATLTHFPLDALERYPVQLSGGQRQRVSLMRALMLDPEILLLDEPLGALDPMIRAELQGELREIFRALNKTVILVTHDMGEAGYIGDTIVLMREGRIVQQGGLRDLVETPAEDFVHRFVHAQRGAREILGGGG
ncbi:MAG: ATP-binding cassette domain-containing protein [Acidobacteria bacterium]|nr:ATP-binding cassette domain-containing protein [Acidobacteriota bacterium]